MALRIQTFSNVTGEDNLFKALGHPMCVPLIRQLIGELEVAGPVAIYDPSSYAESFAALFDLSGVEIAEVWVREHGMVGRPSLGVVTRPVTGVSQTRASTLFVLDFDAERTTVQVGPHLPSHLTLRSLAEARLPEPMLTKPGEYLDSLNFATNYALFREGGGHHTRLVTINYWLRHGAKEISLWCCLFGAEGDVLHEWLEPLPASAVTVTIDSREIKKRFTLPDFCGSLFLHAVGAAGHAVLKYTLDTYGDGGDRLSCTHDANAWPADLYAGLPAPREGERVTLWVQNSHPCPIPAGSLGLRRMGSEDAGFFPEAIPPFATRGIDAGALLPGVGWPQQIEILAGKYFVRPRYEVVDRRGRRHIAHANVERRDLSPDPEIPRLSEGFGKGYLLPAPVLPPEHFTTTILPTPMSTAQQGLPVQLRIYDTMGAEVARHRFGCLPRDHETALDLQALLPGGFDQGHLELMYDFEAGCEADGWLHALIRYEHRRSGHRAETSFGAHIFNTSLVYKDEPQSYSGRPPGLSTRLFLRLGTAGLETVCHLIYPASTPWYGSSDTRLHLHDGNGDRIATRTLEIPCSGSVQWRYRDMFDASERRRAGDRGYIMVRDARCRLFGYHGLTSSAGAFSLDHMFGF